MNDRIIEKGPVRTVAVSDCSFCKHKYTKKIGCKAFTEEIPDEIINGKLLHNRVIEGQTGGFIFTRK